MDPVAVLLSLFVLAHDYGTIASRKLGQSADLNHDIEDGHVATKWNCLGPRRFSHHSNLLSKGPDERGHYDRDLRILEILGISFDEILVYLIN